MIRLAGAIIKDHKGQILLVHRNTSKITHWELPGGKIEPNESAESAVVRELKEELNIEIEVSEEFGKCTFSQDARDFHFVWFNAHIIKGVPTIMEDFFDESQYHSVKHLNSIRNELSANVLLLLDRLVN